MKRSAPTLARVLAAAVFLALHISTAWAQGGGGPGGGCYVCKGILDYVLPEGAYWFGILPADRCPEYLGDRRTSPETRRSYCAQIEAKGAQCVEAARACDSPNGRYCGDHVPDRGAVYSFGRGPPVGRTYAEPSTASQVNGTHPNGTRLVYTESRVVDGQRWYRIHPPGRPAGWVPGSDVSCTRPGNPTPHEWPPNASRLPTERPTAATVAGGRG